MRAICFHRRCVRARRPSQKYRRQRSQCCLPRRRRKMALQHIQKITRDRNITVIERPQIFEAGTSDSRVCVNMDMDNGHNITWTTERWRKSLTELRGQMKKGGQNSSLGTFAAPSATFAAFSLSNTRISRMEIKKDRFKKIHY